MLELNSCSDAGGYGSEILSDATSLAEVLQNRAALHPLRTAYTFLNFGAGAQDEVSYGELDRRARCWAARLQAMDMQGRRALLLYPPGLDYIVAFFACLYAGCIAVPAYPPGSRRHMPRLRAILHDCDAASLLATRKVADEVCRYSATDGEFDKSAWLLTDGEPGADASDWCRHRASPADVAFLQYTSGSTGEAKGVVISHANLLANQALIRQRFGHDENATVVGWLPLYHDMGLIGNVMQPLYCGAHAVLMAPLAFLEKPLRWLQAIADYRAHTSGGPNFAYDLCVQKIAECDAAGLDLSSWRLAFNGAEPVNAKTLADFAGKFAACGFDRRAFYPCYGLAEATLLVSGGVRGAAPRFQAFAKSALEQRIAQPVSADDADARLIVACGRPERKEDLKIVDPDSGVECRAGQIGEICLSGHAIAAGYWQKPQADAQTFVSDAGGKRWLRTGDLGFVDGGELFVSGRLKDLIIVRGRNYYPHDLERAAEDACDALVPAATVACSLQADRHEQLILLAELRRDRLRQPNFEREFTAIRSRLSDECGVQPDRIILLKPGSLLKTSSGKVRRQACCQAYGSGQLAIVAADGEIEIKASNSGPDAGNDTRMLLRLSLKALEQNTGQALLTAHLAHKIAELAALPAGMVDAGAPLTSLGLDSLKAVETKYFIDELLDIDLPLDHLLGDSSLCDAAELALQLLKRNEATPQSDAQTEQPVCAMSFNQRALWMRANIEDEAALYRLTAALQIFGPLDNAALANAWMALCERHDQLRCGFGLDEQLQPVRKPTTGAPAPLERKNCTDEAECERHLRVFNESSFDLQNGPLLRAAVFSCSEHEHVLAFVVHHLIVDFRSLQVLLQELAELYAAQREGATKHLPTPSAAYNDFVLWQRRYLASPSAECDLAYWREQLSGDLPSLGLPSVSTPTPSYRAGSEVLTLSAETLAGLKRLAADCRTTLYAVLLTAFKTLLYRYSHQNDLIVGSPTLGRPQQRFANTVGYFVNPLPLRSRPEGHLRFRAYLAQVTRTVVEGLAHQYYPNGVLLDNLRKENVAADALYRAFFVLQDATDSVAAAMALGKTGLPIRWAGLRADGLAFRDGSEEFDLTLLAAETQGELSLSFRYRLCILESATVARMTKHFETLIRGVLDNPDCRLGELPFLTETEYRDLAAWNATELDCPQHRCIHQLFEAQVETTPDAIALSFEDNHLTYAELNAQANQLAHYLIERGVGPDVLVGICLERSPEMVIGLLGILKAGGAYVPLDPSYPAERRALILADAGVELLLTREACYAEFADSADLTAARDGVIYLDRDSLTMAGYPATNPKLSLHPLHLAYLIYTSGSTGRPKGVAVNHRNAVHSTWARLTGYPDPVNAYLLLSSFAFDSSVAGLFWTLTQGGCLCLLSDDNSKDPAALAALIEQQGISHLLALPSLYALLLEQSPQALSSLQVAIVAGEACPTDVVKRHLAVLPGAKLYNEYGPTEGSVWSSVYQAGADDLERPLAIGRPIANVRLYVLDRCLNPVPVGVAGELYIGGAGIVPGYWQRPGLTAERFLPDPFGPAGGRLYKTGDLVRYRADGALEFLGRIDHQVKLRGFRIELGEIEAHLLKQVEIKDAVVIAREDHPGDKRLVAYVVPYAAVADTEAEQAVVERLKGQLKHQLPDYMLPGAFVVLDAMPLSANGKLDRKQLPAPDLSEQLKKAYVAPRSETEQALAQIWRTLLRVERIGRHDHFFALGGDSILSIQAVSRARQVGLVFTPKQLFERPSLAELAEVVTHCGQTLAEQGSVSGNVPLTPIQHWFFEQDFVRPQHWNQALRLRIKPGLTPELCAAALNSLIAHHDALRLRFEQVGLTWRQTHQADKRNAVLTVVDLSALPDRQRQATIAAQAAACQASLDLAQGPLLRAVWFDLGGGERQLLIAIHHLAVDGVSWRILLEDLDNACRQGLAQQTLSLSTKTSAFKHWAERLAQRAVNGDFNGQAEYWLDPRYRQAQSLPVDYPAGANRVELEDSVEWCLGAEQTRALLNEVPTAYRTHIDEVLLTALVLALGDQIDVTTPTYLLIDRESHGREHLADDLDVSRTVGWFTNVYPLLLTVKADDTPIDALKRIKEQLRAVPENGLSYGALRYLSADANLRQALNAQPAARIIFNYLGQLDTGFAGDALFEASVDTSGPSRDSRGERPHELDVVAHIQSGQLHLSWRYSRERYRRATLERWADRYQTHLQTLIAHCRRADVGGYTPSDFPLAGLDQVQLDELAFAPRQVDDLYPLTPLQHGLLFHSRYQPDTQAYRIQLACRLNGPLNTTAFRQAWQHLLARHAILRTGFIEQGLSQPLQRVERHASVPITEHDWRNLSAEEQQIRWQTLQADDRRQGYDFERPPLMRVNLAACGDERHYLLWSYHHVLLDGWSSPILVEELFHLYRSLAEGHAAELAPARPFRDYVAWLQRQDQVAAEHYWRTQLAGFEAATVLGVDQSPHSKGSVGPLHPQDLCLSDALSARLQDYVKQRRLTLNTLAQAAWGLLLSHYSGRRDVVFGVTVAGRPAELAGIERQVGLFINTVPMRLKLEPEQKLSDWLQTVFEQGRLQSRYDYAALAQIQNWSDIGRGQALFDSLLVFENYPLDQALLEIGGPLRIDQVAGQDPTNYPLTLAVFPGPQLRLTLHYDADRFPGAVAARMLEHLQHLLNAFAEQPEARLANLPSLTSAERRQILHDWNATEVAYSQERCIHQLFEAQVEKTPDAIALSFEGESLSYAELNAQANQLAHYLIERGVGPDVLVGICLERSLAMVVGLLGILKAGGAYVPLDPNYPAERLAFMLADIAPVVILTQAKFAELDFAGAPVLSLDSDWTQVAAYSAGNPRPNLQPSNLAYCIYTSGSTGQPKGAGVPHQGILNRLQWMQAEYGLDSKDAVLQKTPYSFDVSVWEFFWPLMTGARLVVAPPELHKDSQGLIELIRRERITTVHFVPSMLQVFVDTPGAERCTGLKRVVCSGEALPADLVQRFQQKLPAGLHNLYGPTEASVDVSYWACPQDCRETAIPIGKPISNLRLYILDRSLNPVPITTPGELHIAGIGLGRGYLNRPDLTAEKFIPDPFGPAGSRLYKTGDLTRYRPDGNIDYLGRIDHQVKIRGFRIELGEIEAQLLKQPEIKDAVVIAREDHPGDKRLVAYLTSNDDSALSIGDLRAILAEALPDYMLPSAFVILPLMPLSANGKLARGALPAPDREAVISHRYEEPQGTKEIALSCIWKDLLELERVGRNDHFFELGGHSLMVLTLVERLRRLGWLLEPRAVFAYPTLSVLAETIVDYQDNSPAFDMPPNLIPEHFGQSLNLAYFEEFRV
ncbi:non-ribosomal peptide synthetase [Methylomonas rhizoryzae]|uniref:non-ribosomal peptide synthetase n=1 Tax=Methylomonas rhizoryzae TaxID=2608981 RepID=UPI001231CFAF|nr:non-ribosomal peptide synthetase [Methylomonas rhizoryzae]